MVKKIYIGNLSYDVRDKDLEEYFSKIGKVISSSVVMDKMNPNHSRGFGFIEMEDEEADKAIAELDGKEFNGRPLKINEARPLGEGNSRPRNNFRDSNGPRNFRQGSRFGGNRQ